MAEKERGVVKYKDRSGQEIQLSFDIVRSYLVTGKRDLVSQQELMMFMGICKARGLNPFAKDCYLIKYTPDEPAAIITSIDFFRSRARAQADCKGWQKGVIVQKPEGELRYSKGLVLEGEKVVGGWFRTIPDGWTEPFELEVNLNGYIKKTKDGKPTRFWSPDNQPTMIAKVAESQGLRSVWPQEFQELLTHEEANLSPDIVDITPPEPAEEQTAPQTFEELVAEKTLPPKYAPKLEEFIALTAAANEIAPEELKQQAVEQFDSFWQSFRAWCKQNEKKPNVNGQVQQVLDAFKKVKSPDDFSHAVDMLTALEESANLSNADQSLLNSAMSAAEEMLGM